MVGIITTLKEGQEHTGRMEPTRPASPRCAPVPVPLWSCRRADNPIEMRSLGRTLRRWKHQIAAWHLAQVTNGPTEPVNNLIKSEKQGAVGLDELSQLPDPVTDGPTGCSSRRSRPAESETPVNGAHLSLRPSDRRFARDSL